MDVIENFKSYGSSVEKDVQVKEDINAAVKDLEKTSYAISTCLEKMHHPQGIINVQATCEECHIELRKVAGLYEVLRDKIPLGEFFKFHQFFKGTTQRLVGAVALVTYLEDNRLPSHEEVASSMGLNTRREEGFHLELEDYLVGTLFLSQELSRLAINSVSAGDYSRPFKITVFLRDLHAAYSLLNPKNDLRKKYDELKYAVKKTEEVVYNLSLRGLKPQEEQTSG